ncbi:MAG TPA: M48 family metallopeptidase [Terriglobales bacterium]|nr:M48 family metallopeptidase [Terriglobales bacterium]
MKRRSNPTRCLALLLAVAFSTMEIAASGSAPELPNPGDTGVSKQQQEQIGRQAMAEVYKKMPVLPDSSPETQYVRQLGRKLAATIPEEESWPYEFHVIQQKEINAFALPGGPIFVNVGTIIAAENEAQLAGALAHEMSHIYMQHSIKQMRKTQMTRGIAGVLGAVLGSMGGAGGAFGQMGAGIAGGMLTMKYSRADESQADAVGAIIMYKAGYDPRQLARFFQKLASMSNSSNPQFLSDHPNPGNRTQAIEDEVRNWPARDYVNNSQAFIQAKQDAQSMHTYTAREISAGARTGEWGRDNRGGGYGRGDDDDYGPSGPPPNQRPGSGGNVSSVSYRDVRPSGRLTSAQQDLFTISYPDNWRLYQDPGGDGVTIAPAAGVGEGIVAYGVMINTASSSGASIDDATHNVISELMQGNPALRTLGSPQPVRVNGVEGRSVDLTGDSPIAEGGRPLPEHDWLVALPRSDGSMLYAVFIAPERDFSELRPTFENMLRTLHLR